MIGIHVLAQLGKQSRMDSTWFDEVDGLADCCKFVSHCNRKESWRPEPLSGSRSEIQRHWVSALS